MRKSLKLATLLALSLAVLCACVTTQGTQRVQYDAIIRNGMVFDGAGRTRFKADVGIVGGRIARVGDLSSAAAPIDLDATGLFVAPGFINLHSHPGELGLQSAANMLTQGVVTEIVNPDGGGPTDIAAQLAEYGAAGLAVNVGAYIGFGSIWQSVVGTTDRRPTADEIGRMQALAVKNMEAGAWGVSAGLDYKPSYYASTDEVVEIVKSVAAWRTNFPNHDRLTPETGFSSRVGMAETLAIGERAGLVPVITHMKIQGAEQGSAATTLDLITQANARGHYAAADAYPYLAGFSGLASLMVPGWALEGGREAMLGRFKDPAQRAKISQEIERAMNLRFGGPKGVFVVNTDQELVDVMRQLNVPAGEAVMQLLEREEMGAILRFGAEEDLIKLMQYPQTAIACDCGAVADTSGLFNRHPRVYGTFPRVLGHYVRDSNVLSWEDAIRKMSGLPATIIGMADRGFIMPGMMADIAVFDPATIIDRATFAKPTEFSEGMRHVFVNGRLALRDGKPTKVRSGEVLKRTINMPSRPMTPAVARRIEGRAQLASTMGPESYEVVFKLSQASDQAHARGQLQLIDRQSQQTLQVSDFGMLQTTTGWAAITGTAQAVSGEIRGLTLIVDEADPAAGSGRTTIVVEAEGLPRLSGQVESVAVTVEAGVRSREAEGS